MGWRIHRAAGELLEPAARRLVQANAPGDGDAGRRFLAAARAQQIPLTHFFASVDDEHGHVRQSVLIVPGAGRTGMIFTSQPETPVGEAELARLIEHGSGELSGVALAQALLLPSEAGVARALDRAGFEKLADLAYLRRRGELRKTPAPPGPLANAFGEPRVEWRPSEIGATGPDAERPVRVERVSAIDAGDEETDRLLVAGLHASYERTLDCPRLCELRSTEDVLTSHKAVGSFDPSLWWLVFREGEPLGAMLWSPMGPDLSRGGDAAELVYIGLSPVLRGLKLGRALLVYGLGELKRRRINEASCAVDLANAPACAMYNDFGFRRFAERAAWVKPVGVC